MAAGIQGRREAAGFDTEHVAAAPLSIKVAPAVTVMSTDSAVLTSDPQAKRRRVQPLDSTMSAALPVLTQSAVTQVPAVLLQQACAGGAVGFVCFSAILYGSCTCTSMGVHDI